MIGIIDYGMGNLGSVCNAFRFLGAESRLVKAASDLEDCRSVVLPGVGAFGDCMRHLDAHGFVEPLRRWAASGKPFLGICLGLQVLFEGSEESPGTEGLGILPGTVKRFNVPSELKVPQIGWNAVRQARPDCPLFREVEDGAYFYFVHSFYVEPREKSVVAGRTGYGLDYCSVAWRGNLTAVQFHPEKSQSAGLRMLRNFISEG